MSEGHQWSVDWTLAVSAADRPPPLTMSTAVSSDVNQPTMGRVSKLIICNNGPTGLRLHQPAHWLTSDWPLLQWVARPAMVSLPHGRLTTRVIPKIAPTPGGCVHIGFVDVHFGVFKGGFFLTPVKVNTPCGGKNYGKGYVLPRKLLASRFLFILKNKSSGFPDLPDVQKYGNTCNSSN